MSDKTNKLHIYMIKPEFTRAEDIIEDDADEHEIDGVGVFYTEDSFPRMPGWVKTFFRDRLVDLKLITSTARGVLLIERPDGDKTARFAVAFGYGRNLLKEGVFEERFGLKVVLNAVDHQSLRSIHKTTLGSVPKQSREQVSREGVAANFGIDIEQDLINEVTGKSHDQRLGKTISGRDSLSVAVKIDIDEIAEFLDCCLALHRSETYKAQFGWIDQIKEMRDPAVHRALNEKLLAQLKSRRLEKIWMAVPEVVDWVNIKGFRYAKPKMGELRPDLDILEFLDSVQEKELTIDFLKAYQIHAVSAKTDDVFDRWNSYRCIYAEITESDKVYVLNSGKWYEVAPDFASAVHSDFQSTPNADMDFPEYAHNDEGAYNEALPGSINNSYCMDRKLISYGGGHSTIEFCDLITEDRKLVHIKRYGGSSQLSHLFAQGVVAAELFVEDEGFRSALNEKLPPALRLSDIRARPDASDYEVVFAIISKSSNPLEIPFFSKVSLKNARRRLQGYGYKVSKKKIQRVST
jgi:uncharacterized protein (TIGR04141 family)